MDLEELSTKFESNWVIRLDWNGSKTFQKKIGDCSVNRFDDAHRETLNQVWVLLIFSLLKECAVFTVVMVSLYSKHTNVSNLDLYKYNKT